MSDTSETNPNPTVEAIRQLAEVQKHLLDGMEELSNRMALYDRFITEVGKTLKHVSENQAVLGQNDTNLRDELLKQREAIHHLLNGGKPTRPGRPELMN